MGSSRTSILALAAVLAVAVTLVGGVLLPRLGSTAAADAPPAVRVEHAGVSSVADTPGRRHRSRTTRTPRGTWCWDAPRPEEPRPRPARERVDEQVQLVDEAV